MCDSIGVLGQQAPAAAISDFEKVSPTNLQYNADELVKNYCNDIFRAAKDINVIVDTLPSEDSTVEQQAEYLRKMEADNLQEAQKLRVLIEQGEKGLNKLQEALVDIAQSQLEARKIEAEFVCGSLPTTNLPPSSEITGDFSDLPQR